MTLTYNNFGSGLPSLDSSFIGEFSPSTSHPTHDPALIEYSTTYLLQRFHKTLSNFVTQEIFVLSLDFAGLPPMSSFTAPQMLLHVTNSVTTDKNAAILKPTSAVLAPVAASIVVLNTTLEQDGETLLRLWEAFRRDEEELRQGLGDDVSKWYGVEVEGRRVTRLHWGGMRLSGIIPAEIGALSALTYLTLCNNSLSGSLPPEIGNLTSLKQLYVHCNIFTGAIPSSSAKLTNLSSVGLYSNYFSTNIPPSAIVRNKERVQTYIYTTFRRPTIRYIIICIITTIRRPPANLIHPVFTFLSKIKDITLTVFSFLGKEEVGLHMAAKLTCV